MLTSLKQCNSCPTELVRDLRRVEFSQVTSSKIVDFFVTQTPDHDKSTLIEADFGASQIGGNIMEWTKACQTRSSVYSRTHFVSSNVPSTVFLILKRRRKIRANFVSKSPSNWIKIHATKNLSETSWNTNMEFALSLPAAAVVLRWCYWIQTSGRNPPPVWLYLLPCSLSFNTALFTSDTWNPIFSILANIIPRVVPHSCSFPVSPVREPCSSLNRT